MTGEGDATGPVLDRVTLTVGGRGAAAAHGEDVRRLYGAVYAEPPYREGPADVAEFVAGWPARCAQPGFRFVLARHGDEPVGFAFGHGLTARTGWWDGLREPVPGDLTREDGARTFAVIELAVVAGHRRVGVGFALHAHLLAGLPHERATLLVRPDAAPAQRAYRAWGYRMLGSLQPYPDGPVYDAMVLDLGAGR